MKDESAVKATAFIAIISFIGVALYKGANFQKELFDAITQAVSITVAARYVYIKWVWKWCSLFEVMHSVPCLEGQWHGKFQTTWQPSDGSLPLSGAIDVKITQPDMFTVKITQQSGESTSYSFAESFEHEEDGSIFLNFSYRNEPKASVRDRSQISYGTSRYKLERNKSKATLTGSYYTDRKTTGDVVLEKNK